MMQSIDIFFCHFTLNFKVLYKTRTLLRYLHQKRSKKLKRLLSKPPLELLNNHIPKKDTLNKLLGNENYKEGTLGYELEKLLCSNPPKWLRTNHKRQIIHILFNYKSTVAECIKSHFFQLGNQRQNKKALNCWLYTLWTMPDLSVRLWKEFFKGRKCVNIAEWDFDYLLHEPIEVLRNLIKKQNVAEEAPFCF